MVYSHARERWWSEEMFNIIVENVVDGKHLSNRLLQKFCYLRNPKVTENETYLAIVRSKIVIHRPGDRV